MKAPSARARERVRLCKRRPKRALTLVLGAVDFRETSASAVPFWGRSATVVWRSECGENIARWVQRSNRQSHAGPGCIRPRGSGVAAMTMQGPPRTSGEPSRDGARLHRRG